MDFSVACAANIYKHLTIRWDRSPYWELRHLLFSNIKVLLVMRGQSFFHSGLYCDICKRNSSTLRMCLLLRPAYMCLYMSSLCCSQKSKIILFGQKWCVRLNETIEPAVRMYMIDTCIPPVNRCEHSSVWWALARHVSHWQFES